MIAKPPSTDGKHQVTTENEIVTLELLKLRHAGRYGEKTSYLRRKVVIPLEMPKTIRGKCMLTEGYFIKLPDNFNLFKKIKSYISIY